MKKSEIDRIDKEMRKNDEESLVYTLYRQILEAVDDFEEFTGLDMDHVDDDVAEHIAREMLAPYKSMESFDYKE